MGELCESPESRAFEKFKYFIESEVAQSCPILCNPMDSSLH